jgi:magnesium chelatase subunit I
MEALLSAAERRALLNGEDETTVRISDLMHVAPAITGKVELVYEGEQEGAQNVALSLIGQAIDATFGQYFPDPDDKEEGRPAYREVLNWFSSGHSLDLEQEMSRAAYADALEQIDGLAALVEEHTTPDSEDERLVTMEFVLEALHQNSLIGKEIGDGIQSYDDIMGSMLSSLGDGGFGEDDFGDEDVDDDDDDPLSRYR